MNSTAVLLATLGLVIAGQASAATATAHLSDVDYLKANRCRGLAEGFGVTNASGIDALIKSEGRNRIEVVYERAQREQVQGKRDAAKSDGKDRFQAELNGYCSAFLGGADTASAR
jgi:hypothetical protein